MKIILIILLLYKLFTNKIFSNSLDNIMIILKQDSEYSPLYVQ